jgi:hypothetical protein
LIQPGVVVSDDFGASMKLRGGSQGVASRRRD